MNTVESNEAPPPPYSETDIYSNPGSVGRSSSGQRPNASSSSSSAPSQATPSTSGDSAASQPPASVTSSQSDVVFTPPLTPRTASVHEVATYFPASASAQAAEAYFESRPLPHNFFQDQHVTHALNVTPSSRPEDFVYVEEWSARDITPQDWQTFLNFLLPAHTALSNEVILDRKLRAEEENTAGSASSSSGRTHASAQLEHLRTSQADAESATPRTEARHEAQSVVSEWNHGFFQPRSIWIRLLYLDPQRPLGGQQTPMLGSWTQQPGFEQSQLHPGPYQPPLHPPPPHLGPQPYHWGGGPSYHPHVKQPGFNFAGIRMNDDGFYIGNSVAADRHGVRLGDFIADNRGLRFRDNVVVGPGMFSGSGPNRDYPGAMYHGGAYHGGPANPPPGFHVQPPFMPPNSFPGPVPSQKPPRRRSDSSDEDSDDSDDSDDTSSIGSLPDYDDLEGTQMPVYRARLRTWLSQPERHITKEDVQRLKAEIREARRTKAEYPPSNVDKKAVKAEIKALTSEWRTLKRAQRKERRRERRARRKMERRARKSVDRGHGRGSGSWGAPPNVPPPGMPGLRGPPGPWIGTPTGGPPFGFAPPGFGPGAPGPFTGTPFQPQAQGSWSQDELHNGGCKRPDSSSSWDHHGKRREESVAQPPAEPAAEPHEASQAKFRQLDDLEKQLARKFTQMYETKEEKEEEDKTESGKQQAVAEGSGTVMQRLEAEVDELQKQVDKLRVEADEAFARELEEQERREAGRR